MKAKSSDRLDRKSSQPSAGERASRKTSDPFRDAQLIDIGIAERAYRERDSARRQNIFLSIITLVSVLATTILATKDHTAAVVYREDGKSGSIALMGYAGTNTTPTLNTVENQLAQWIQYVRDIPGGDAALAERNQNAAMIMIAKGSRAQNDLAAFYMTNDPAKLSKVSQRLVLHPIVNRLTDLTYQILWTEQVSDSSGNSTKTSYQGTVTLGAQPQAPSDPVLGQYNPAGIYIANFDLKV